MDVAGDWFMQSVSGEVVEMHYLWTTPVKLGDSRLRALLPELRKTPYEKGIQITIQAMQARVGNTSRSATAATAMAI